MTRVEIAGWLQLVVGLVALYFTIDSGGPVLDAIAQLGARGGQLPAAFAGSQGVLRVFMYLLLLVVVGALFFTGLGVVMGALFRHLGAAHAQHSAFTFVVMLIVLAISITLGVINHPLWIICSLMTVLLLALAGLAGVSQDSNLYWSVAAIGVGAVLFCGGLATALAYAPNSTLNAESSTATKVPSAESTK